MSIIFHIMHEEYERLLTAESVYLKSVEKAVQGSPRIKQIGNKNYLYLQKRDGQKVISDYIGPAQSKKAAEILDAVQRRRKNQESLNKIRSDLKDVKKVLSGKI
jgi:hypothetical protein